MRLAYVDLGAGAAGDMLLAALADVGRRAHIDLEDAVSAAVESLGLGCAVRFEEARRGGLRCLRAEVRTDGATHEIPVLREALANVRAGERAKARALRGLEVLVGAEARVHGVDTEELRLHELGSADTAADLIGAAVALEVLEVTRIVATPVPVPRGWIDSAHGTLPLPAPVTLEMLRGVATYGVDDADELVTPTALAILLAHGCTFGPLPPLTVEEIGLGGGTREVRERPNICRVLVGEITGAAEPSPGPAGAPRGVRLERDVLLETNIDDQPPEGLGHALEALLDVGAKDAWITPIVMKKSRPAFLVSVLVAPEAEQRTLEILFRETTTLGVRRREVAKWTLDRRDLHVPVRGSNVRVKIARLRGEVVNVAPEYDDCALVAGRSGLSFKDVYAEAEAKARRLLEG